jgi:DUF3060 family protein
MEVYALQFRRDELKTGEGPSSHVVGGFVMEMTKLALVGAVLAMPLAAAADKSFTGDKKIDWDCAKDPELSITTGNAVINVKGQCKSIAITGKDCKLTIESIADLVLNGDGYTVTVGTLDEIVVNGDKNSVTAATLGEVTLNGNSNNLVYKKAKSGTKPSVQDNGKSNAVGKAKDDKPKK